MRAYRMNGGGLDGAIGMRTAEATIMVASSGSSMNKIAGNII